MSLSNFSGPSFAKSLIDAKGGISKANHYRVLLPTLFIGGDALSMDILCRSTNMPSRNITTAPRKTNMKSIEMPTGYVNGQVDMAFTETTDQTASFYFDLWQNTVIDPETYEVAYRLDVVKDVLIMSNDDKGLPSYICVLKNAFPKLRSPTDHSDNTENTAKEVRVTFEYEDYEVIDSLEFSAFRDLARSIGAGKIKIPTNILRNVTINTGLGQLQERGIDVIRGIIG